MKRSFLVILARKMSKSQTVRFHIEESWLLISVCWRKICKEKSSCAGHSFKKEKSHLCVIFLKEKSYHTCSLSQRKILLCMPFFLWLSHLTHLVFATSSLAFSLIYGIHIMDGLNIYLSRQYLKKFASNVISALTLCFFMWKGTFDYIRLESRQKG